MTVNKIDEELDLVKDWQKRGKPMGSEPETPWLDHCEKLANISGMSRVTFMRYVDQSSLRNGMFHKKPPRWEEHLVRETVVGKEEYEEGGMTKEKPAVMEVWKVKWDEVENKCKERKTTEQDSHSAGHVNDDQYEDIIKTIDEWYRVKKDAATEDRGEQKIGKKTFPLIGVMGQRTRPVTGARS
ncbi:hypothetical protein B0T25DRAFT_7507 [Lasiosphaeria hispida]|uniref:Uncharacterized protein n=1 Tax=Lasiosphaeria hispida TaxID=260671 RepID=A0AAJ0HTJ2_9PEZI|nr:hypothetical protein B0T25DRAFT_7507 [Lasiosphaeria hispida]